MELRHLRYFVAAAQEVHFGRAAERLHISQPALGQQIREFERELGIELFDRLPRGIRLSAAGQTLLADVHRILADLQEAFAQAQCVGRGESGALRVAHEPDSILRTAAVAGHVIPDFCIRYANADVQAVPMSSIEQLAALADGRIDVAIAHSPMDPPPYVAREVLDENALTGALLPARHPLAKNARVRCRDLGALPCLVASRDPACGFSAMLVRELGARGLDVELAERSMADLSLQIGLIALGAAWMPGSPQIVPFINTPEVVFREWVEPPIPFPCCVLWRRNDGSPLVAKFVSLAIELRDGPRSRTESQDVVHLRPVRGSAR